MDRVERQSSGIEANSRQSIHGTVTVRTHRLNSDVMVGDVQFGLVLFGIVVDLHRILTRASAALVMSSRRKMSLE